MERNKTMLIITSESPGDFKVERKKKHKSKLKCKEHINTKTTNFALYREMLEKEEKKIVKKDNVNKERKEVLFLISFVDLSVGYLVALVEEQRHLHSFLLELLQTFSVVPLLLPLPSSPLRCSSSHSSVNLAAQLANTQENQ